MKKTLFAALILMLQACTINGLTNDYSKLDEPQKALIVPIGNFDNAGTSNIYKVNGQQLHSELQKHPKSLVYVFKNGCVSKSCLPMVAYEKFAAKNGYKLFLVMNGYANLEDTWGQRNGFTSPLYAIDNDFYQSKYRSKYSRLFENELVGKPKDTPEGKFLGNLFFFESGKLAQILGDLPEVQL